MHRKVSHLTEIIMVAETMIVGKISSNNYSNNNNYGGNNNLEIMEIIAVSERTTFNSLGNNNNNYNYENNNYRSRI